VHLVVLLLELVLSQLVPQASMLQVVEVQFLSQYLPSQLDLDEPFHASMSSLITTILPLPTKLLVTESEQPLLQEEATVFSIAT
jgi:hypothetical protein